MITLTDPGYVVRTHSLINEHVSFGRLGLAVIDEQHRFRVRHRLALTEMGEAVDLLVMSATPIPRSLALTLHGDLDLTIIDELPPGRQSVRTGLRPGRARSRVYDFIRGEVGKGRQAFIVYPLVENSDKLDLLSATEEYDRLSNEIFPDLTLGLVQAHMSAEERDERIQTFD